MRLFLVIDDSSGEASMLVLARDEAQAIDLARPTLDGDAEEPSDLRAVCANTTKSPQTREMLKFWGDVAIESTDRGNTPQSVQDELNATGSLIYAVGVVAERTRGASVTAERTRAATIAEWTADAAMKMADDARARRDGLAARELDYGARVARQIAKAVRAENSEDTEPQVPAVTEPQS